MSELLEQGEQAPGLFEELRAMPALHRVCVVMAATCLVIIALEGALLVPYTVLRWGWGYTLN
jgi:hypothetical protein